VYIYKTKENKNMKHYLILLLTIKLFCLPHLNSEEFNFDFIFSKSNEGWVGDFADYDQSQEAFYELAWGWSNLPTELPLDGQILKKGIYLSGNNHSDDLFMFIKRQIEGLKPDTLYELSFIVTIENNIPAGQIGIGGAPGESVFFKVGASRKEPKKVAEKGIYRLNVDKGNQSQKGKNAVVVGDLSNPLVNPSDLSYQPKHFTNEVPLKLKTDHKGRLWVFVGTDSGFEGLTHYYIASISIHIINEERGG
jgi:hypothetical protein